MEFYTLGAPEPSARTGARDPAGDLAVGVGPLRLPGYLDHPEFARRVDENQIVYEENHRWAGPLADELLRVVGANLAAMIPSDKVVVYPARPPFPLRYRILLEIERFEADSDGAVTLLARWSIVPGAGGSALSIGRVALVEPVRSGRAADLVAAHTAVAVRLSRALTATLESLSGTSQPREAPSGEANATAPQT